MALSNVKTLEFEAPTERILVQVPGHLRDSMPEFIEMRMSELRVILKSLQREDYSIIILLARSIKKAGFKYSINTISDIAIIIEKEATAQNKSTIYRWVNILLNYLTKLRVI